MDDTKSNGKQWSPNGQMDRTPKAIPEIFLTRLLSTKGTIEKYVVDFFRTILTVDEHVPPAIKWLFDLLDEGARKHNITDPEVLHAWKSNRYSDISENHCSGHISYLINDSLVL